jgi:hypothetical protein
VRCLEVRVCVRVHVSVCVAALVVCVCCADAVMRGCGLGSLFGERVHRVLACVIHVSSSSLLLFSHKLAMASIISNARPPHAVCTPLLSLLSSLDRTSCL